MGLHDCRPQPAWNDDDATEHPAMAHELSNAISGYDAAALADFTPAERDELLRARWSPHRCIDATREASKERRSGPSPTPRLVRRRRPARPDDGTSTAAGNLRPVGEPPGTLAGGAPPSRTRASVGGCGTSYFDLKKSGAVAKAAEQRLSHVWATLTMGDSIDSSAAGDGRPGLSSSPAF
jgi:hypothetical protein